MVNSSIAHSLGRLFQSLITQRSLFISLLCFAVSLSSPCALAESPKTPTEADRVKVAQEAMSKGLELIRAKRYAEAAESFDLSYRSHPSNEVLHLLARLYDKLPKECIRSLSAWKMLIDRCDETCELRQDALAKLKAAELACKGELMIKTEPGQAELFINNESVSETPFSLSTVARLHHIVILKEGYEPIEKEIELERGWRSDEIVVTLNPNRQSRGAESPKTKARALAAAPSQTKTKTNTNLSTSAPQNVGASTLERPDPIAEPPQEAPPPSWHVAFSAGEDPFTRLAPLKQVKSGKIAISGERSIISRLNCEYRSRFQRFIPLIGCDGARVAPFDRFYLSVVPQQDSYLYLVMSNDKGQWQLLFPQEGEDHLFKADELSSIPKKEWILFDKVRDTIDVISLIASPRPIPELEAERKRSNSHGLPSEVMQYFVPMAQEYSEKPVKSSRVLKAQTQYVINHPQVLHTSFEVYR